MKEMEKVVEKIRKNEEKPGNRKPPRQGAAAGDLQPKPEETGNRKPPRQGAAAGDLQPKPETGSGNGEKWGKMWKNVKNVEK